MMQPKVSIIIINWNGLKDTIECLESLKRITYPNYKVIVVDNASTGNDVEVLEEKFGNYVHVIENDRNYGLSEGVNIGIRYALANHNPDYVVVCNNDMVVDPEALTHLVNVAESNTVIGIVGPKAYLYDSPQRLEFTTGKIHLWRGRTSHVSTGQIDHGQYDSLCQAEYLQDPFLLIKRQVMDKIGVYDDRYFVYWEEPDYCLRARRAGYQVMYCPQARIWHKIRLSAPKETSKIREYYFTRNRFLFMKKHASKKQLACFLLWFLLRDSWFHTGAVLLYYKNPKALLSFYRGVRDGVSLLFTSEAKLETNLQP